MISYTDIYAAYGVDIQQRNDVQPTAEGLRAAAKVLEGKAKELDKPKFTQEQTDVINLARRTKFKVYDFKGSKHTRINTDAGNDLGKSAWLDTYFEVRDLLMTKDYYSRGQYYTTKIFKDDDDEVIVGLVWPKS